MSLTNIIQDIFYTSKDNFHEVCMQVFAYQYKHNHVYQKYVNAVKKVADIRHITDIPFLPIQFFKNHKVQCTDTMGNIPIPELIFKSSGTTGATTSTHYITNKNIYQTSLYTHFESFFGHPQSFVILALLPSYMEKGNSSLVYMVQQLMEKSNKPENAFFLYNHLELFHTLQKLERKEKKTILIGVTYGLLDFAQAYPMQLKNTIVIETGGMKGRKEEMIKEEVHLILKKKLGIPSVATEYGMTELLSQAYSIKDGQLNTPHWMKILIREVNDPFHISTVGKGALNIIDLANINSCSFIATDDIGEVYEDGSFELLGRLDSSDIRGCSLLYT